MIWRSILTALALAMLPGPLMADQPALAGQQGDDASVATIREVHYSTTPKRVRLVFWLDRPVAWHLKTLGEPARIELEVPNSRPAADLRGYFAHHAVVDGLDARGEPHGSTHFSLRLKETVRPRAFLLNRGAGKSYLVLDLFRGAKSASPLDGSAPVASSPHPGTAAKREVAASKPKPGGSNDRAVGGGEVFRFWALLQRLERGLRDMHAANLARSEEVDRLFSMDCADVGLLADRARALREEARASADDPGLNLEGGVRKGFDQTNSVLSSGTRQSAYVGLKWDFLSGGLVENRGRARWYELRAERADVVARMEYHDRLNQCRADRIPDAFLPMRYRLLSLKTELLEQLLPAFRQAYLRGGVFLEDVLQVEQELQASANDLAGIRRRLAAFSQQALLHPRMFPLLDVDMESVMRAIEQDELMPRAEMLNADITAQEHENEKDARLYAFLRYEAYGHQFRSRGPAAGLGFRVPLFEDKNAGVEAYREDSRARLQNAVASRKRDAGRAYRKFVEERERGIRQWYRFLRVMERLRRSRLEEEYNHWGVDTRAAAQRAEEAIDAAIELERAFELMYRRASEVFSAAHVLYQPGMVHVLPLVDEQWRQRGGERSLYVWSKAFNEQSNEFIQAFLRAKQVGTVVLSSGKQVAQDKLKAFLVQARRAGIKVEPMFASNDWLSPDHYDEAVRRISEVMGAADSTAVHWQETAGPKESAPPLQQLGGSPVLIERPLQVVRGDVKTGFHLAHLDIEPQGLPRMKGKKREQAAALIDLLTHLRRNLAANIRLAVSVPVSWEAGDYLQIAGLADRLYLMDYGNSDPDVLLRRLHNARLAVPDSRLVLALRASDFRSEVELEQVIQAIRSRTGIEHFAIHALRDYLNLTNQNALDKGVKHGARQ